MEKSVKRGRGMLRKLLPAFFFLAFWTNSVFAADSLYSSCYSYYYNSSSGQYFVECLARRGSDGSFIWIDLPSYCSHPVRRFYSTRLENIPYFNPPYYINGWLSSSSANNCSDTPSIIVQSVTNYRPWAYLSPPYSSSVYSSSNTWVRFAVVSPSGSPRGYVLPQFAFGDGMLFCIANCKSDLAAKKSAIQSEGSTLLTGITGSSGTSLPCFGIFCLTGKETQLQPLVNTVLLLGSIGSAFIVFRKKPKKGRERNK